MRPRQRCRGWEDGELSGMWSYRRLDTLLMEAAAALPRMTVWSGAITPTALGMLQMRPWQRCHG